MEPAGASKSIGQNLSIWRLSVKVINHYLMKIKQLEAISFGNSKEACASFVDHVIEHYNQDKEHGMGLFEKVFPQNAHPTWENKGGFTQVTLYGFYATYSHRLAYAEELEQLGAPKEPFLSSQKHFLFFLFGTVEKIKRIAFYAITTSQAFHVFKDFVDYRFPRQIPKALLLEDKVTEVKDRWTVGPILASHTWYKEGQSYEDCPDTLEKIFITFRAKMNPLADILSKIDSLGDETTIKVTRGSICLYNRVIPIDHFPTLIAYLSTVAEGKETGLKGGLRPPPANFSWLDHLMPLTSHAHILECRQKAGTLIFSAIKNPEAPRSFTLCPKWFLDYKQSPRVTWAYSGQTKVTPNVWDEAPLTGEILADVHHKLPALKETDLSHLSLVFQKGGKEIREPFVQAFDGELYVDGLRVFRAYGLWYEPNANYLNLVQKNMYELVRGHLIPGKETAHLKKPWVKGKLKDKDLARFQTNCSSLQKMKGAYLRKDGTILCRTLKVPFFGRMTTVKRFHDALQTLLKDPSKKKLSENDLETLGIPKTKAGEIFKQLTTERQCVDEKGKIVVPYYSGIDPKLQKFLAQFPDYYEEGHFNTLFDTENNYLVGDTLTPSDIELFDVAFFCEESSELFLYHVKEGVDGDHMRTVCSQIRNAAKKLKAALSGTSDLVEEYAKYIYKDHPNHPASLRIKSLYTEAEFKQLFELFFTRPREQIVFVLTFMDNHSPQRFLEKSPEFQNNSKKDPVISSIISQLEVVAVCRDIKALGFGFKICQVSRNGEGASSGAVELPPPSKEELLAQNEFSLREYDFGVEKVKRQVTRGDGNCSFHAALGRKRGNQYVYAPTGIDIRDDFKGQFQFNLQTLTWETPEISARFLSLFQGLIGKALRNDLTDASDQLFLDDLKIDNKPLKQFFTEQVATFLDHKGVPQELLKGLKKTKTPQQKTLKEFYEWLKTGDHGSFFLAELGLARLEEIAGELNGATYRTNARALRTLVTKVKKALWERWNVVILDQSYYLSDDELALIGIKYQKSIVLIERGTNHAISAREISPQDGLNPVFIYAQDKHFERCTPIEQ